MQDSAKADTAGQLMLEKVWNGTYLEIVWSHTDKGDFHSLPHQKQKSSSSEVFWWLWFCVKLGAFPCALLLDMTIVQQPPAGWAFSTQRLPSALGYFRGVRVWCVRGKSSPQESWMTGRRDLSLELQDPHSSKYSHFLEEMGEIHQPAVLLHLCPVWTALLLVQPEGGMPP